MLALLCVVHVSLRRVVDKLFPANRADPSSLLSHRVYFDLFFALCFLIGVHGFSTLKIFVILSLNYMIAKSMGGSKALPAVTWIFNIGFLFLNEYFDGYRFAHIHQIAAPMVSLPSRDLTRVCGLNVRIRLEGSTIDGISCSISTRYD